MATYYEVLEIARGVPADEVKKAYRALAIKWHPDKNPENAQAEERFKEVVEAYAVLGNPDTRKSYDLQLAMGGGDRFDPSKIDPSTMDPEFFMDTFVGLFGAYLDEKVPGFRGAVRSAANDAKAKEKKKQARSSVCKRCNGKGRVRLKQGQFVLFVACNVCKDSQKSGRI